MLRTMECIRMGTGRGTRRVYLY